MYGESSIPVREAVPDYPDRYVGKRLLGIDAFHYGHYWCGDRIEILERERVLRERDGDAVLEERYETRAEIPVRLVEGGPGEYLRNVGAYLDRFLDDASDPVYAADSARWERVSAYARRWARAAERDAPDARADRSASRQSGGRNRG